MVKYCQFDFSLYNTHNSSWLAPHMHTPLPDLSKRPHLELPTSRTKIKRVIARWIALLIMEDGWCSLTFAKVTKPSIIKAAAKSPYLTHLSN